jgi:hypothetical protein
MQKPLSFALATSQSLYSFKPGILPLLLAIYPPLFHYGNNASIVTLPSLERALLLYSILAFVLYIIFFFVMRGQSIKAANATFVFLIFFNLYGAAYNYLFNQDVIRVEDYTLLPLFLLLALYASWFITKVDSDRFWRAALLLLGILIAFNLLKIIPAEVAKHKISNQEKIIAPAIANASRKLGYPDIYFILFDEFAGFGSMRDYWNYQGVDDFSQFLQSKGFFIAESSRSSSIYTLQQMSERLNYQGYPFGKEDPSRYYDAIANNRVMSYLKSLGYTTVVFDEKKFGYPAIPKMTADYLFEYNSINFTKISTDTGNLFDDFGILVADNTMLRAFPLFYNKSMDPMVKKHEDMVRFTAMKISDLNEVPSPKFVYTHLLLPHYPFMFSENGSINDLIYYYNWNYYLDNYKFTIDLAEKMVTSILENADPAHPPIIILQSDHGARNVLVAARNGVQLENYPEEYKTDILNAMYLPTYDISQLPQDINPINTFPIIFNHYFNADIPLTK